MSLSNATRQKADDGTVVIVANRGPHDFVWENGAWVAKRAGGGLMSMIEPLARQPNVAWFCCVSEPPESEGERDTLYTTAKDQTDPDLNVVPVPLPAAVYHDYYSDISNEVLWMLQHHLVGQFGYTELDEKRHRAWNAYLEANRLMAEGVVATDIPIRAFLIQDYHLYPLPGLLRERFPDTPSLHFIHIPFPDPSVLKLLPQTWRESILHGLLGADIVGLQTGADVRAFLSCCEEFLGATVDYYRKSVVQRGRTVKVRAIPTSTDPSAIRALQESAEVQKAREKLAPDLSEKNVIRVDRLDPSKNQLLGFRAFGRLLEQQPELCGHIRFLAFLIPSRTDRTVYRDYYEAVMAEIETVNARFRNACGGDPIRLIYANDRPMAIAGMEMCDVLLVNVREDGMTLAVKEWAVVSKKPGVAIVSETAGVAGECGDNALRVCPLDVEGTANALRAALEMPIEERKERLERLQTGINQWTARDWLEAQLKELNLTLPARTKPSPNPAPASSPAGTVEMELTVLNQEGIHARPAAAFVRCAREFDNNIEIVKGGEAYSAKSILAVLTANLNCGSTFMLRVSGRDAQGVANQLKELIHSFKDWS